MDFVPSVEHIRNLERQEAMKKEFNPSAEYVQQLEEQQQNKPSLARRLYQGLTELPGQIWEAGKHPLDTAQDVGAGLIGSLQHAGVSMGELGKYLGENPRINPLLALGIHAPESLRMESPNIRELAGLGNENRFDLQEKLSSGNPNPLPGNVGRGIGGVMFGGRNLLPSLSKSGVVEGLGQIGSNALWGAGQAEPGNRLEEGLISGLLAGGLGLGGKAIAKGVPYLNPINYSAEKQIKNVINTGAENKNIYNQKYKEFFDKADKSGYGWQIKNPNIDINTIEKYTPKKSINRVKEFIDNPTTQSAHNAKSDLLKIKRKLDKKDTLIGGEKKQYTAISDAIDHIENNMFRNKKGKINDALNTEYGDIQSGYRQEVVPYTTNKAIKEFKAGEKTAGDTVKSIRGGKFKAQRGEFHPELYRAEQMMKALKALGFGTGIIGGGLLGGKYLFDSINK